MNESIIELPKIEGKIAGLAFDIYTQMLNNIKTTHKEICSLCANYVGINTTRIRNHFHGSEFGQCFRKTQLDMHDVKPDYGISKLLEFQDGHLHEDTILNLLSQSYQITNKNTEAILERNVVLANNTIRVKVVLHTDGILELVSQNKKILIECKAVKNWYWKNRLEKNQLPISYFGQVQCYMEAYNIDYALIFVKNRESSEIAYPIIIKKDDIYIKRRFHFLAAISYSNSIPELVPKEYEKKTNDACKFCRHFTHCWGN